MTDETPKMTEAELKAAAGELLKRMGKAARDSSDVLEGTDVKVVRAGPADDSEEVLLAMTPDALEGLIVEWLPEHQAVIQTDIGDDVLEQLQAFKERAERQITGLQRQNGELKRRMLAAEAEAEALGARNDELEQVIRRIRRDAAHAVAPRPRALEDGRAVMDAGAGR